jgi:hypothetical protein
MELMRIFGDVDIVQDHRTFTSVEDLHRRFRNSGADEMVVVLPLTMVMKLIEIGLKPIVPEMVYLHNCNGCSSFNPETDVIVKGRHSRFVQFRRVVSIDIKYEPVEKT